MTYPAHHTGTPAAIHSRRAFYLLSNYMLTRASPMTCYDHTGVGRELGLGGLHEYTELKVKTRLSVEQLLSFPCFALLCFFLECLSV